MIVVICEQFPPMPVNCTMGQWSDWTPCSVSCGQGRRTRQRKLAGSGCQTLKNKEEIFCVDLPGCIFPQEEAKGSQYE